MSEDRAREIDEIATMLDSVGSEYLDWKGQLFAIAEKVYEWKTNALASAHALRCTCLPIGGGDPDPRCVELWALGGGAGDAEPGPGPLEGFRPNLSQ